MEIESRVETLMLKYLRTSRIEEETLRNIVIPQLFIVGAKTIDDLEHVERSDLNIEGISAVDQRKLWKFIRSNVSDMTSLNLTVHDRDEHTSQCVSSVHYILCGNDLFSHDIVENVIDDLDPEKTTLSDVTAQITNEMGLNDDKAIELFSHEGYPLHHNDITSTITLEKWGITDNDLFYVMVRNKEQPGQEMFATLPELDHDIGEEIFTVETPYHGTFTVNAYMDSDSPEDIAQKIYSVTNIPVPYMSLFIRRGYTYERMDAFTELQDRDIIRVVLRDPQELIQPHTIHYGIRSYNPVVQQTELGLSKFYSILKYLCSPQPMDGQYDIEKLLSYLLQLTKFPPLVYALRVLHEKSFLSIPGWTSLVEGCFFLFKAIMDSFANVPDTEIFEYSDYVWSLLIQCSQSITDVSDVECDQVSLVCPLSGIRIMKPVLISQSLSGPFDESNILAKIKDGEDFSNFGIHAIKKCDLEDDHVTTRLLTFFPWEHDKKVYKWRKRHYPVMRCVKIDLTFNWYDLPEALKHLCIVNPCGLYAGTECLTYIDEGRLVYFIGASKGDDEHRRIYDPICDHHEYLQLVHKTKLERIGRSKSEEHVTNDLTSVLVNVFDQSACRKANIDRLSAIIPAHETVQWEPEEAIVVILDYSGSMNSTVYPETEGVRRIDAAKELFNAFATRTQAYRLHHCFGLTLFSSWVTVKQPITKNTEDFEMSLRDLEPGGGTSLTDAMIDGVRQLQKYNCIRRIICLTDGYNSSRTPYELVLNIARSANVIIDTVLLTDAKGNEQQKAISHATGGVCVLPLTMREALRFFEMDMILSVKERETSRMLLPSHLSHFRYSPYEDEDSFQSSYIEEFSLVRTTSAKRYLSNDRLVFSHEQRRILRELREVMQNPHPDFKVFPNTDNFDNWKVLMKGPEKSAYEGGVFTLGVKFPSKYPAVPPEVRFLTRIYHCNISRSSGRICHAILGSSYTPATSMRDILSYIYGLLMCPDIETPLDSTLADEYGYARHREKDLNKPFPHARYFQEANTYFQEAREHVLLYANKPFKKLELELDDLV